MQALIACAEENCGSMVVWDVRVDGVVDQLAPLTEWQGSLINVGSIDPVYALSITALNIVNYGPSVPAPMMNGRSVAMAIHSPTQLFLGPMNLGQHVHLQLEMMICDGKFRRYYGLRQRRDVPEEYSGVLEAGGLYRGAVVQGADGEAEPSIPLRMPMHQAGGIQWLRAASPRFSPGEHKRLDFRVISRETVQSWERVLDGSSPHRAVIGWSTLYQLAVEDIALSVDPSAGADFLAR
jgi:hypothetical protein